ncbi:hypothetical protein MKW94_028008 [Papaver nudicaule]|uniref:Late embryogenesis abundant protein LEA-2 subgroup domain-containing protein n=1 Tax=Papaver nudicaule TaxID=74823 RepID=A0AA41VCT1_PAPNU|nr:hypothetical protein [Papaver nudicaule]
MGGRCVCCSCFLTTVIFIGGVVCLIVFLGVLPYKNIKFHVLDASLTQFYLTNDDILHYHLALNFSLRNSNKKTSISYYYIGSSTYCYGKDLAVVSLTPFRQGSKNTTVLAPVFQGQAPLKLRGSDLRDFNNDQRDGSYSIHVQLYLTSKLKYAGGGRGSNIGIIAKCGLLRIPLLGSSFDNQTASGGIFNTKKCKVSTVNLDSSSG